MGSIVYHRHRRSQQVATIKTTAIPPTNEWGEAHQDGFLHGPSACIIATSSESRGGRMWQPVARLRSRCGEVASADPAGPARSAPDRPSACVA